MTNKDIIIKSVRFIEDNLKEDIDVFKVSQEVCYSLYHFMRLFQSITGFSPKNYIQQRRLTEAVYALRNTDQKIFDIALDYQFGSHEAFSRAFQRHFHINPIQIRKGASLIGLPLVGPLTPDFIYQSEKVRCQQPELVLMQEKTLMGLSFFVDENAEINDLSKEWQRLIKEVASIVDRIIPERFYQVQYWSENQELGGMYFFTGIEVSTLSSLNPVFVIKTLPAGKYLRFIHKGLANKVGYTYKYIYTQYLPDTEYKLTKPFNFEFYGEKCTGPYDENSESEIYIPVE